MLMTSELDCLSWLEDFCFVILKSLESFFVFLGIFVLEFEDLSFKLMILVTYCLSPFLASKLICNVSWVEIFDISCRYYLFCNRRNRSCLYAGTGLSFRGQTLSCQKVPSRDIRSYFPAFPCSSVLLICTN